MCFTIIQFFNELKLAPCYKVSFCGHCGLRLNKLSSSPLRVKEAEEVCRQKKGKALYKVKPRHDSGIVSI